MARIAGVDIPNDKRVVVSLTALNNRKTWRDKK